MFVMWLISWNFRVAMFIMGLLTAEWMCPGGRGGEGVVRGVIETNTGEFR